MPDNHHGLPLAVKRSRSRMISGRLYVAVCLGMAWSISLGGAARAQAPAPVDEGAGESPQVAVVESGDAEASPAVDPESVGPREIDLRDVSTLGEALKRITAAAGIDFQQPLPESSPVQPLEKPVDFWRALDHVLDEVSLDIDPYGGDAARLRLRPSQAQRPGRKSSAAYAGPFRLEPMVITSRRVLRHPVLSGLSVELELAWPPGLTPIALSLPLDQIRAELDSGEVLTAAGGGVLDVATGRDIPLAILQVPLQLPVESADRLRSLQGRLRMLLPSESHAFEFSLESATESQQVGALRVRPEGIRKDGELHEVRLGIDVEVPPEAMESHRGFLLDNEVHAIDSTGQRTEHLGYQLYRQTKDGLGIGYLFDLGDSTEGWKLVYRSPTQLTRGEIDFTIDDVPLP